MSKRYFALATQPRATGIGAIFEESTRTRGIRSRRVVSGRATGMGQTGDAARVATVSTTTGSSERRPKNESSRAVDCWAWPTRGAKSRASASGTRERTNIGLIVNAAA